MHADSQIAMLKYMHCQNLHVDTTPTTITSKIFVSALYVVKLGMKVKLSVVIYWHC